jgi:hypothetical protein
LLWEWGSLTAIITGAPSTSLAHSSASAFPGLGALLGTLPVVGLRDGAVLVVWVSGLVRGEVTLPEFLGVIKVLSVLWDVCGGKTYLWCWGDWSGNNNGDKGNKSEKFHF